jgi:hypothetical protein
MSHDEQNHHEHAVAAIADRRYEAAGDALARAAWATLAQPRPGQGPFDADERGWVGEAVQHLLTSAVCYRVAGLPDRAASRGTEAEAVTTDLETGLTHPVQRACLQELVGDARLVGGSNDAADAYEDAAESVEDPHDWSTTPLFQAAAAPLQQVARSTANGEIAVSWEALHGPDPAAPGRFLAHRATVKRQRFPALLEAVVTESYLAAPRGTTEYNNASYQCPRCDSNDINRVAENVLCLRCSTPSQRQ